MFASSGGEGRMMGKGHKWTLWDVINVLCLDTVNLKFTEWYIHKI